MAESEVQPKPDAGGVDALAEELWANSASPGAAPTDVERGFARAVLASDWLAAHDIEVRRDTAERIAQAIEYHGRGRGNLTREAAARIARGEASRG